MKFLITGGFLVLSFFIFRIWYPDQNLILRLTRFTFLSNMRYQLLGSQRTTNKAEFLRFPRHKSHKSQGYIFESISIFANNFPSVNNIRYHLCGLVVRIPGYRSRRPEFDSRRYQISWEIVVLERGPLIIVRTIEGLLEWRSSGFSLENRN
jgi:hypothetical protein